MIDILSPTEMFKFFAKTAPIITSDASLSVKSHMIIMSAILDVSFSW